MSYLPQILSLNDPISKIRLGLKESKVLRKLNVFNIDDLLVLNATRVLSVPGFGYGTYHKIMAIQRFLFKRFYCDSVSDLTISLNKPVTILDIGTNIRGLFERSGVRTIEDFLAFDAKLVLKIPGYSQRTYERIVNIQEVISQKLNLLNSESPLCQDS